MNLRRWLFAALAALAACDGGNSCVSGETWSSGACEHPVDDLNRMHQVVANSLKIARDFIACDKSVGAGNRSWSSRASAPPRPRRGSATSIATKMPPQA